MIADDPPFDRTNENREATARHLSADAIWQTVVLASMCVLAFTSALGVLFLVGAHGKVLDILAFSAGLVVGPVCALVYAALLSPTEGGGRQTARTECLIVLAASLALAAIVAVQAMSGVWRNPDIWTQGSEFVVLAIPPCGAILACLFYSCSGRAPFCRQFFDDGIARRASAALFVVMLSSSIVSLFWFEPGGLRWTGFIAVWNSNPFASTSARSWSLATALAAAGLTGVWLVAWKESHIKGPSWFSRLVLVAAIVFASAAFFDFSLKLEVLHYLTNVGPALHMRHGGTLMVDTFSQYGPGAATITYLAFLVGPLTLGTAQIAVQMCNLCFYAVWLICLYRLTPFRIAALLLGLIAISLQLAVWDFGDGNINVAPSILGLRHLPTLCLVLAISLLQPPNTRSPLTFLSLGLASVWSLETFVGSAFVYCGFTACVAFRERSLHKFLVDMVLLLASSSLFLAALSLTTLLKSGSFPRIDLYLQYFQVYNPLSEFWSHPSGSSFFGWLVPLGVVSLVFTEATLILCARAHAYRPELHGDPNILLYRCLPMALFVVPLSSYYVFRSYDYTLAIALLPTCTIIIACGLPIAVDLARKSGWMRVILAIPFAICAYAVVYSELALGRAEGPYSLAFAECHEHDRCTPLAMLRQLKSRLAIRDVMEPTGNYLSDRWRSSLRPDDVVAKAVGLITAYAGHDEHVSVLIGDVSSDLALLYTDRAQHFPVSFGFTDELAHGIAAAIVRTPGDLPNTSLVIASQTDFMSSLQLQIWQRIRFENKLCPLPSQSLLAFRVSTEPNCAAVDLDAR